MNIYEIFPDYDDFSKSDQELLLNDINTIISFNNFLKSNKDSFENLRTNKTFERISNEIAMENPFKEESFFHSNFNNQQQSERYKRDIFNLLDKNCITELYYTHNPKENNRTGLLIYSNNKSKTINLINSSIIIENEVLYYELLKEKCYVKISIASGGNFVIKGKDSTSWKVVNSKYYHSFPYNLDYYRNKFSANDTNPSAEELKQVYEDLLSRKTAVMLCKNYIDFDSLVKKIQQQLAKNFYNNVNTSVYIKQVDANGKVLKENLLKTNYQKPWDVKLNITLKTNGEVIIKHVASDNYLKNYVDKWGKEAKARGLEINIEKLQRQVIHDFEAQSTEKSFYQKFILESKALLDNSIIGYIEGIQVTQKIGKNIWEEGTINQSTWLSKDKEHTKWPKYAQINPLVGGVVDGVVDEIIGIPLAVKGVYEIVTDDEKQEALKNIFTKEGAKQMFNGLVSNAKETLNDEDKSQHFAGQTTVSVATMLSGVGFFTKAEKLDDLKELAEVAAKKGDGFIDGASTLSKIDELKKLARHIDNDKAIDALIKEFGTDTFDSHLDELIDAAKLVKDRKLIEVIKRWRLGRKLETNVTKKIEKELTELSGEYIEDIAQKMGKSVNELAKMDRLTQLQIHLPKEELLKYAKKGTKLEELKDTYIILDDVFIDKVTNGLGDVVGFKLFANETKLSDLSPLTANQAAFQKMLQNGKVDFNLRSVKDEVINIFGDKKNVTMEKWIQTTGKGAEEANNLTTKTLF